MVTIIIGQGSLRGGKSTTDDGFEYLEFLEIPYAKPPVGKLRFKSPQPAEPWEGERNATSFNRNRTAIIFDDAQNLVKGSEDCLYMNVYTPRLPRNESDLLPVMVLIHGGGYLWGNGTEKNDSGPDFFIKHDVVMVSFNYRLSVFGFLSLGIPEAAGNMGLKDQVEALKWVQANIHHFGGDKNNVTIFGISAGASNIEYLVVSPSAKGLFHKAIMQSGSCLNHWAGNYDPKKLAYELAVDLGYESPAGEIKSLYQFLFNAPAESLATKAVHIAEKYMLDRIYFGFVPTPIEIDFGDHDAFLTENPYTLLKRGLYNRVPVIKGFCNREGSLTIKPKTLSDILKNNNFIDYWPFDLDAEDKKKYGEIFRQLYVKTLKPDDEEDRIAVDFIGDLDITSGVWLGGKLMARNGSPVWLYEFSYDGDVNFSRNKLGALKRKGAGHADDANYVLCNDQSRNARNHDLIVRNLMCKMWTNFAKTNSPTPAYDLKSEDWPNYTEENPAYLNIDVTTSLKYNHDPEKMSVFEEIADKYRK